MQIDYIIIELIECGTRLEDPGTTVTGHCLNQALLHGQSGKNCTSCQCGRTRALQLY